MHIKITFLASPELPTLNRLGITSAINTPHQVHFSPSEETSLLFRLSVLLKCLNSVHRCFPEHPPQSHLNVQ